MVFMEGVSNCDWKLYVSSSQPYARSIFATLELLSDEAQNDGKGGS